MENMQQKRFDNADIPLRFKDSCFSQFNNDEIKQATEFIDGYGWRVLVILGTLGTGKTHMGCAVIKEFCRQATATYTTAYAMSQRIIEDQNANHFNRYPLLVIDEIGRSFDTKAEKDRFFDLVNYRYENMMPVVIIGNKKLKQVIDIVGPAVSDRMRENASLLTMTGKSRR